MASTALSLCRAWLSCWRTTTHLSEERTGCSNEDREVQIALNEWITGLDVVDSHSKGFPLFCSIGEGGASGTLQWRLLLKQVGK